MDAGNNSKSFEDLKVYQKARAITRLIYAATNDPIFRRDVDLCRQMRRAVVSIGSNIAEGYERGSNKEFAQFLQISKGSCGELRSQLNTALDLEYISHNNHQQLYNECRHLGAMISKFIGYLKTSEWKDRQRNPIDSQSNGANEP